ncbi:uncharacterized protein LOC141911406 [Tubulanus polymorphus]|uniref:uncharacterized protein LOC141911406 n=1 Tax=Tubulanus polymorphus TaxID=672921 RepID=UPI003DA44894
MTLTNTRYGYKIRAFKCIRIVVNLNTDFVQQNRMVSLKVIALLLVLGLVAVQAKSSGNDIELETGEDSGKRIEKRYKAAIATEAIKAALALGTNLLDSISQHYYTNEAMTCYWNDWRARDARARIERTFRHCRFSRYKRIWGWVSGRWYCLMKQVACKALGHALGK